MARDETLGRNRYGRGRQQPQTQYDQSQPRERPSGTPNWQHDYSYGGSRREVENEGYGRPEYRDEDRGEYRGEYRGQYRGEFGETYRPSWPEQRGSYGERDYGQGSGGYGEGGLGREGGRSEEWGWSIPGERAGTGRSMPFYGEQGYYRDNYGSLTPDRGYIIPPLAGDFMGTGVPWPSRSQGRQPMGQRGHMGKGPKGYKRPDDRIHEEVCEALTRHPYIDASDIEIKVKNGEVTLTGKVYERRQKHMAEDAAESVSGVKDVHNEIKINRDHPGFSGEFSDETENGREREEEDASTRRKDRSSTGR